MKKTLALLVVVSILASVCLFPVSAAEVECVPEETVATQQEGESTVTPYIMHHYNKTITQLYASPELAPASIYYKEYNLNAWFEGTLYLQNIVIQSDGFWLATYIGTLQGQI